MRFLDRLPPLAQDGLLAVATAILLSVIVFATPGAGALDLAAALAGSLALVAWRRAPLVSLLVSTACMLVVAARIQPGPLAASPVLVSVFAAVRAGHWPAAALAGAVFLGADLVVNLPGAGGAGQILQNTTLLVGWFVAAGVVATVTRHRQAYLEEAERRAAEAERTREEVARRRAGEERLRIARELHDSLTHSISIIKVQAGVAVHLARRRGEEVPPRCSPSRRPAATPCASCAPPWRCCATPATPRTRLRPAGSTGSTIWWSGPAPPGCRRR
ncbi:histidine kinase dimerization/phosphoacceptor domain-containing protein [Thermocatellispora tengchongensis]|uniref:histidine kinase dimerization/phosphoacceptor domain-containing protein n=1 Tax=Thermocatellispora tengchongensis TaxID=1073253 RepID=UPI003642A1F6